MKKGTGWKEITINDLLNDCYHESPITSIKKVSSNSLLFKFKRYVRRVPSKVTIPFTNRKITMYDDPPVAKYPRAQFLIKNFDSAEFSDKFNRWNNPEFDLATKIKEGMKIRIYNACPPKYSKNVPETFTISIKGKNTNLFFKERKASKLLKKIKKK